MNIRNATPFPTHTFPEYDDAPRITLELLTKVTLAAKAGGVFIAETQADFAAPLSSDAPMGEVHPQVFAGQPGVTVVGSLETVDRPFQRATATLCVGLERRALHAYGPRVWTGSGSDLLASPPSLTRSVPMSWAVAMGGRHGVPPGFLPGTRIPAPSTEIAFPANPDGTGFYRDAGEALGKPLPQLELPSEPVRRWDERPPPACWAPLPNRSSIRMAGLVVKDNRVRGTSSVTTQADILSDTPRDLRFSSLLPGTAISLSLEADGTARTLIQCVLPRPPFRVVFHAGERSTEGVPRLEHVQLRLDQRVVALRYRTAVRQPLIAGELRTTIIEPDVVAARELLGSVA